MLEKAAEEHKRAAKAFAERIKDMKIPADEMEQFEKVEKDYQKWKKKLDE
jgi:hypothetical protein